MCSSRHRTDGVADPLQKATGVANVCVPVAKRRFTITAVLPGYTAVMVNRLFATGTHTLATPVAFWSGSATPSVRCRDEHTDAFAHPDPRQGHVTSGRVHAHRGDTDR